MKSQSFSHSGNVGDVWASIPVMNGYFQQTGKKVLLHLISGQQGKYYEGAVHPTKNEAGENVMLNQKMIDMMLPLLKAQPFIEDVKIISSDEEKLEKNVDLDEIRRSYVGMPGLSINRWYMYVYPDLSCDVTTRWLHIPDTEKNLAKDKILINRTERYLNDKIDYSFLKAYEDDCVFIGTMREYNNFCMGFDLNIRKINVLDFLEYAQAIRQSRFYLSNQSQGFQLAQGLRHPRILEVCGWAPNVIVHGEEAYDFTAQMGVEYLVEKLHKKNPPSGEFLKALSDRITRSE